ncbi:MAG: glycoside hydrolase family 3 N-terminal domain-containing protein [Spirochaetota bacterium]
MKKNNIHNKFIIFLLFILTITIIWSLYKENIYNKRISLYEAITKLNNDIKENLHKELAIEEMKNIHENKLSDKEKFMLRSDKEKLEDLYNKLSLKEKVGQLFIVGHKGEKLDNRAISFIKDRHIGGFALFRKNAKSIEQLYGMIMMMQRESLEKENGIPLFIAGDNEPGKRWMSMSRLIDAVPVSNKIPDLYSPEEAESEFISLAENLKYLGYNVDFAPVLDVNTNPDNPIIGDRAFSSNTDVVISYSQKFIEAFKESGVITTAKHFPGHGDTGEDSHKTLPHIEHNLERLNQVELAPFKNAIKQNIDMIMTAHIIYDELDPEYPATLSSKILTDLLRDKLGYEGVVITDDMYMRAILNNYDQKKAVVDAINAGADIILCVQIYKNLNSNEELYDAVLKAVKEGGISEDRLREAVLRVLKLKAKNPILSNIWGEANPLYNNR